MQTCPQMMALDSQSGNMAGISQSGRAANLQTYAALRQGGQALQRKALRQGGQALQEISIPAGNSVFDQFADAEQI